jgi:hypothetical protein
VTLKAQPAVQLVHVDELRPWERNPRSITNERFEALKRSLAEEPVHLAARPIIALPDGRRSPATCASAQRRSSSTRATHGS